MAPRKDTEQSDDWRNQAGQANQPDKANKAIRKATRTATSNPTRTVAISRMTSAKASVREAATT